MPRSWLFAFYEPLNWWSERLFKTGQLLNAVVQTDHFGWIGHYVPCSCQHTNSTFPFRVTFFWGGEGAKRVPFKQLRYQHPHTHTHTHCKANDSQTCDCRFDSGLGRKWYLRALEAAGTILVIIRVRSLHTSTPKRSFIAIVVTCRDLNNCVLFLYNNDNWGS